MFNQDKLYVSTVAASFNALALLIVATVGYFFQHDGTEQYRWLLVIAAGMVFCCAVLKNYRLKEYLWQDDPFLVAAITWSALETTVWISFVFLGNNDLNGIVLVWVILAARLIEWLRTWHITARIFRRLSPNTNGGMEHNLLLWVAAFIKAGIGLILILAIDSYPTLQIPLLLPFGILLFFVFLLIHQAFGVESA